MREINDHRVWVLQPRPYGQDRMKEFLRENIVAIGWREWDLWKEYKQGLDAFIKSAYSGCSKKHKAHAAGELKRFYGGIRPGDYVMVPYGTEVYIAEINDGEPYFSTGKRVIRDGYPNQRKVRWIRKRPYHRANFPQRVQRALKYSGIVCSVPILVSELEKHFSASAPSRMRRSAHSRRFPSRPIGHKKEQDYISYRRKQSVNVTRIHNCLINDFKKYLKDEANVDEGNYDVLVRKGPRGRALLIEAKSHGSGPMARHQIREAIGQLFDYQFILEKEMNLKNTELAILTPEEPDADVKELVRRIKIEMIWQKGNRFGGTPRIDRWLKSK